LSADSTYMHTHTVANTYTHMNINTHTYSVIFVELHASHKATRRQSHNKWAALANEFLKFYLTF